MGKKFHSELESLKDDVVSMSKLATCFLERSVQALVIQDPELAKSVLEIKDQILQMDREIEEKALKLLTLYQPMAVDVRTLAAILKMITYLTRIGRYGKDIADLVDELSKKPHVKKMIHIPMMLERVLGMIGDSMEAFSTGNVEKIKADDMIQRDDELDEMRWEIFRECLTYMMEDTTTITRCAHYIMIARYLERCGDHACKLAEKVHYMVTGKRLEIK